jgi:hypothetical protein
MRGKNRAANQARRNERNPTSGNPAGCHAGSRSPNRCPRIRARHGLSSPRTPRASILLCWWSVSGWPWRWWRAASICLPGWLEKRWWRLPGSQGSAMRSTVAVTERSCRSCRLHVGCQNRQGNPVGERVVGDVWVCRLIFRLFFFGCSVARNPFLTPKTADIADISPNPLQ